jgi:hypothetical protein
MKTVSVSLSVFRGKAWALLTTTAGKGILVCLGLPRRASQCPWFPALVSYVYTNTSTHRESFPQKAPEGSLPGHPGFLDATQEAKLAELRESLKAKGYEKRLDDSSLVSIATPLDTVTA